MAENDAPLKPDDFPVHADKNKILTTTGNLSPWPRTKRRLTKLPSD